ncbi:protein of unknown function [Methylocaldum szegediense]|uniref:Uncharacterized protein n=1 Tax=Methylocaldum szegediense TaxID=73780 RepID=A0ABM9I9C8_9GAMM|nr:protein of unknown function [Methylocaldum szegediense]
MLTFADLGIPSFNPLPVIKPGVTLGLPVKGVNVAVSIHSRLLSRELQLQEDDDSGVNPVSIHSRLLSRELRRHSVLIYRKSMFQSTPGY